MDIVDPWVDSHEAQDEYGVKVIAQPDKNHYDAIILAVAHREFRDMGVQTIKSFGNKNCILYDLKSVFSANESALRL